MLAQDKFVRFDLLRAAHFSTAVFFRALGAQEHHGRVIVKPLVVHVKLTYYQAYLSRALRDKLGLHVLALDWSHIQSEGAQRREKVKEKVSKSKRTEDAPQSGSLSYETLLINPRTLQQAVDSWIAKFATTEQLTGKVPVLFVALHACGSLTLDIFRTFLSTLKDNSGDWEPASALVVGCCYNLLVQEGIVRSIKHSHPQVS